MGDVKIPVDITNPGQVFACLGFLEAADILLGDAEGGFDWSNEAAVKFRLRARGGGNPVKAVLEFLAVADVRSLAPAGSPQSTEKWQVKTNLLKIGEPFPYPEPSSPATLPAILTAENMPLIQIDHWGDATRRDNVKFWAGAGGYPGAALARDALALVRERIQEAIDEPFSLSAMQSSSFRFDWRRDYIPIDVGFSPNAHGALEMVGYPLVEILAAIGLTNARPERLEKLAYRYAVIEARENRPLFAPSLLRAALGCADLPFSRRTFRIRLGWPGQENQARCITDVIEEPK